MGHWINDYLNELEQTIQGTGWTLTNQPSGDTGPVTFTHEDGSEATILQSPSQTHYRIDYKESNNATAAISDKNTRWPQLENGIEWLVHTLEKHEQDN